jgi:hypothetical protein
MPPLKRIRLLGGHCWRRRGSRSTRLVVAPCICSKQTSNHYDLMSVYEATARWAYISADSVARQVHSRSTQPSYADSARRSRRKPADLWRWWAWGRPSTSGSGGGLHRSLRLLTFSQQRVRELQCIAVALRLRITRGVARRDAWIWRTDRSPAAPILAGALGPIEPRGRWRVACAPAGFYTKLDAPR